jgi:hypothetical protein
VGGMYGFLTIDVAYGHTFSMVLTRARKHTHTLNNPRWIFLNPILPSRARDNGFVWVWSLISHPKERTHITGAENKKERGNFVIRKGI